MILLRLTILITVFITLSTSASGQIEYYHFDRKLAEKLMFSAVNRIRFENHLSLLKRDETLLKVAEHHTRDMIKRDFFDHINPDGEGPRERALDMGVPYPVSENLGILSSYGLKIDKVVEELLESLMQSPEHRANILNPHISGIGISFAQDRDQKTNIIDIRKIGKSKLGYGTVIVCQLFMKRGLKNMSPDTIPEKISKGDSFSFTAETYRDFDTVLIETQEVNNGVMIRTTEIALFERTFDEKVSFVKKGVFEMRIKGNIYGNGELSESEDLATFKIVVE